MARTRGRSITWRFRKTGRPRATPGPPYAAAQETPSGVACVFTNPTNVEGSGDDAYANNANRGGETQLRRPSNLPGRTSPGYRTGRLSRPEGKAGRKASSSTGTHDEGDR